MAAKKDQTPVVDEKSDQAPEMWLAFNTLPQAVLDQLPEGFDTLVETIKADSFDLISGKIVFGGNEKTVEKSIRDFFSGNSIATIAELRIKMGTDIVFRQRLNRTTDLMNKWQHGKDPSKVEAKVDATVEGEGDGS